MEEPAIARLVGCLVVVGGTTCRAKEPERMVFLVVLVDRVKLARIVCHAVVIRDLVGSRISARLAAIGRRAPRGNGQTNLFDERTTASRAGESVRAGRKVGPFVRALVTIVPSHGRCRKGERES